MPIVSVIIPTFNRSKFLISAINSVINQTYKDMEIIVCDDRSTDNTSDVLKKLIDGRIKYVMNCGIKGPSSTRNTAILSAEGEYIAFLDDDDEWLPNKIETQLNVLETAKRNVCGIYSGVKCINRKSGEQFIEDPGKGKLKGNLLEELGKYNPIKTSTLVIKKKCLDEVGLFDETIKYMEDRELLIRLSRKWDFEYIPQPLINYYYHEEGQLTNNIENQVYGKEIVFKKYSKIFKKNEITWSNYTLGLGVQCCQINKMKKGRKYILQSLKFRPFRKIAYYHLISSFFGNKIYLRLRNIKNNYKN